MDPIEALVVPATNIICTPGLHNNRRVHQLCEAPEHKRAYQIMKERGEVADSLLHVLLSDAEHEVRKETIVRWMVRLSLLVPVREGTEPLALPVALSSPPPTPAGHIYLREGVPSYIAPALLLDGREGE